MNTSYSIFTTSQHSSICNSIPPSISIPVAVEDEVRIPLNSDRRDGGGGNSYSSTSLLIRLATKISRSRWYAFLRRVFHYQNGSGSRSDLGPNPFDCKEWMVVEFVALMIQIAITVYTLSVSGDERPVWPMRIWLSGYAFGCLLSVVVLVWRYRLLHRFDRVDGGGLDIEQTRDHQESRSLQYMVKCKASVELVFAIWFVMGNVWVFDTRFGSYHRAPKLHVLCISLLAWNAVTYSFPFILFVFLCCVVPLLSSSLGYNMNTASLQRGATEESLARLPCFNYGPDLENPEDSECCICLAKYKEKEEVRELPCHHRFHLKCVDQWLRIISCCPLCKQGLHI